MRKIAVFTGTRAEYGLLYWLMRAIQNDPELSLQLIVSGAHLSPNFGETWQCIVSDGFTIDAKIEMLLSSNTANGIIKSMGLGLVGFADALSQLKPDILVILGDRYEALAIAQAALIMTIPIAHLHGGELSLGAYDDAIRHAISKMATFHFVAAEPYRRRLMQMGEEPAKVFNFGAPGLEQIVKTEKYSFSELAEQLQISLKKPYLLITLHPITLAEESTQETCEALFKVLADFPAYEVLFTYPNADNGGYEIIALLENYCKNTPGAFLFKSLGVKTYLSAITHAEAVLGNSSSGIIEVPTFGLPTINIGLRQQGRLAAKSVIHTEATPAAIKKALTLALSPAFKAMCRNVENPYGTGNVSARIVAELKRLKLSPIKHFQDMEIYDAIGSE